jgi:hypothetical protein
MLNLKLVRAVRPMKTHVHHRRDCRTCGGAEARRQI